MHKTPLYNNWYFLAAVWFTINLIQSYFSTLIDDEAYYWMFSQQLDWSFFDHPPMVALFIKAGYSLFPNELGVRLITTLTQLMFLRIVWTFIHHPEKDNYTWLFFLIAGCLPLLQIYGFITTPDVSLLLFGSLTLWSYRRYLERENFLNILLFAMSCALLMYSKYHGALLIFAILSANLKLLTKPTFYLVGIIALGLFTPHMIWQWEHDFISFQYHLFDRPSTSYPALFLENLLNQFLLYHPYIWILLVPVLIKKWKTTTHPIFDKTLLYIFIWFGILLLIFSLRLKRVEPHWTILFSIPIIVFLFDYLIEQPLKLALFKKIGFVTILLLGVTRLAFVFINTPLTGITYKPKEKVAKIEIIANGKPIIHLDNYQNAAINTFYSNGKQKIYGLNSRMAGRANQFDIWDHTTEIYKEDVLIVSKIPTPIMNDTLYLQDNTKLFYHVYKKYFNIKKLTLDVELPKDSTYLASDRLKFKATITNPYPYEIETKKIWMFLNTGQIFKRCHQVKAPPILQPNSTNEMTLITTLPDTTGTFETRFTLQLQNDYPVNYFGDTHTFTLKRKTKNSMFK